MQAVYIIGSKGIPAKYGGFETFVEKLTEQQKNETIKYYVSCMRENSLKSSITQDVFEHNGATCFSIDVPNIGPAKAILYDVLSLKKAIDMAITNKDKAPIFYVLACRIGPFIGYFKKQINRLGGKLYVNPDGHEWLREKWSVPVRKYWKFSESLMTKYADLLICDSQTIEKYIKKEYASYSPRTAYIAYGTDFEKTSLKASDGKVRTWFEEKDILEGEYYLVVGRFVPENNYEAMIRGFMASDSKKDFVLITNVEKNQFYQKLQRETNFEQDSRVKFVGTVYDQELLKYIREQAFAYLHGHEVGGTNPSLLEALASTRLNLLLDVGFNREVADDSAVYWKKDDLSEVISKVEQFETEKILDFDQASLERIKNSFTWGYIVERYEDLFLSKTTYRL